MVRLTYPDGEILNYTYDRGGLLKQATGLKRGNSYPYIDINYRYDLVGNILGTDNTGVPIPAGGEHGGPTRQDFTYDNMYQLIMATGSHQSADNKKTTYTNSFTYDIIENITQKVQQHRVVHGTESATEPRDTCPISSLVRP